ncbi:MAG: hypothetical protein K5925_06090 [Bacilli bacterium]|nr:hypothetical protein [Bacilli bacterium]
MATKRGLCPYCKINNIQHSIFLVNPEASSVFCGTNMHQINPIVAIRNYEHYMEKMIAKADNTLNVVCNPYLAYQEYADVIEIDDSYIEPYLGRLLCLVYMSKVRSSHLIDAKLLLEVGIEKNFTKISDAQLVFSFLRRIVKVTEEYLTAVRKRLTFRQFFYDTDCLKLYLTHVAEAKEFENVIYDATNVIKKKYENEKINTFLNYLAEKISEKEMYLGDYEFITVAGITYKYDKTNLDYSVEIKNCKKKTIDAKTSRYRMASLSPEAKNMRFIKDEVFKDYTSMIRAKKAAVVWFILFYIAFAACGACAYFFKDNFHLFIIFVAASGLLFVLGTVFLSLNISWSSQINKKKRKLEVY